MGEAFYKNLVLALLFFLSLFFFIGILENIALDYELTGFVVHPRYSNYSAAEQGFVFNGSNNIISVNDDAVYGTGYYSVNGSAWQSFSLNGSFYNGDSNWLSGVSSYTLQGLGYGEHYIIVYSCTYSAGNSSWDCHDSKWQLIVVNNSPVIIPNCTDNCSSLSYQCGTQTICGNGVNCGNCSTGYNCNNGICVVSQTVTCNGSTCASGEYCSNSVCLLNVTGKTYFVATNGNDNNPGNLTHSWKTWQKAFNTANPGDIVYFRGGVYYTDIGLYLSKSGSSSNWIRFFNYPDEIPILNCAEMSSSWNVGITINEKSYLHLKGLHLTDIKQRTGQPDLCIGVRGMSLNHVKLENMDLSNIDGSGVYLSETIYAEVINCDAHDCIDTYASDPGGWGMGFISDGTTRGYTHFYGCRAWNCSDQGFGLTNFIPEVIVDNCWSYYNGFLNGEGMGFKNGMGMSPSDGERDIYVKNSISAYNRGSGIDTNDAPYLQTQWFYNNFLYHNGEEGWHRDGYGFLGYNAIGSNSDRIYRNNLCYANRDGDWMIYNNPYYTAEYNSWQTPPNVNVTDEDFVNLDISQLMRSRKSDGSLPDITFGHLAQGSDLIDAGTVISGYHCTTAGAHPGEDCVEWYGSAPDLGSFESNY